jgi:hypothetical protein
MVAVLLGNGSFESEAALQGGTERVVTSRRCAKKFITAQRIGPAQS